MEIDNHSMVASLDYNTSAGCGMRPESIHGSDSAGAKRAFHFFLVNELTPTYLEERGGGGGVTD